MFDLGFDGAVSTPEWEDVLWARFSVGMRHDRAAPLQVKDLEVATAFGPGLLSVVRSFRSGSHQSPRLRHGSGARSSIVSSFAQIFVSGSGIPQVAEEPPPCWHEGPER